MAGKTTVMREVAIIQLLAQIGSFVPAKMAELGLCDFLFSRLGASDDILKGQSTFMVEMSETSEILRHATHKSLIILDEVGRGTSTYDGLSIAWGLVEHFIEETQAITLFATHYHELIDVAEKSPHAKNLTVETVNHKGNVQFLYRLIEKGASQSYGIYVAKLAGIPQKILVRSAEILHSLEENHTQFEIKKTVTPDYLKELEEEIANMDVMQMTPLEALIKLNHLKSQIDVR
jgi:DNA mismatch repair protein MutS